MFLAYHIFIRLLSFYTKECALYKKLKSILKITRREREREREIKKYPSEKYIKMQTFLG